MHMREGIGSFDVQQIYVIDDPVKLLSRNTRKINVYTSSNARDVQRCAPSNSRNIDHIESKQRNKLLFDAS